MKLQLYRHKCPTCGGALSRTDLYPRRELYEFMFPSYKTPLVKTVLLIVVAGFGLAFVHVLIAALAVLGIGAWYFWNYHGALQCDLCGEYFISGQFASRGAQRVPWNKADSKKLLWRWCVVLLIGVLFFLPFYWLERSLDKGCAATCKDRGLLHESNLIGLQCECYREGEKPQLGR